MSNIGSTKNPSNKTNNLFLEWILTIIAAINCILVVAIFAYINNPNLISDFTSQWPFPMIYFFEIIAIGIIGIVAMGNLQQPEKSNWSTVFWVCSGILLSLVILGAWTIGFFLLPAMVIYLVLGILSDRRTGNAIPRNLIFFVSGGIAQALFVLLTLF